jgi:hypothetical protein
MVAARVSLDALGNKLIAYHAGYRTSVFHPVADNFIELPRRKEMWRVCRNDASIRMDALYSYQLTIKS